MKINSVIRYIIVLSALLMLSFGSAFAQEIDIDELSDEQLMVLLVQITDRLGLEMPQPKGSGTENSEPTATPYAAAAADEPEYFESWMNKKLIVGALPAYMFIQPTQEVQEESTPGKPGKKKDDPASCPVGQLCAPDDWYCYWDLIDGECKCMCG